MTLTAFESLVRSGKIDTVLVAFPDPFGRLVGKRFRADYFLSSVLKHGTHGCNYMLTVNLRSEERRVGKECRSRWSPYH